MSRVASDGELMVRAKIRVVNAVPCCVPMLLGVAVNQRR